MIMAAPVVQHQSPTTGLNPSVTTGRWRQMLATYQERAAGTLAQHRPHIRTCVACAQPWPCAHAINAELILEL